MESSFVEKTLEVLVDTVVSMSQLYAHATKFNSPVGWVRKCCQQVKESDPSPLQSIGETHLEPWH